MKGKRNNENRKRFLFPILLFLVFSICFIFLRNAQAAGNITPRRPHFTSNRNGKVPKYWLKLENQKKYAWLKKAKFVGKAVCFDCHPQPGDEPGLSRPEWDMDVHEKIAGTFQCEACHGPASLHVKANAAKFILDPTYLSKPIQNEMCQSCHLQGMVAFHAGANLSCLSCHQFHTYDNPYDLKIRPERDLCYKCHPGVRSQFQMYTHHPVNEGIMNCTDCHAAHFTSMFNEIAGQSAVMGTRASIESCGKCHPAEAGPYVASPTALEGCIGCHMPHGSPFSNLERMPQPALCIKCHEPSSFQYGLVTMGMKCTNCHPDIHGSDHTRYLFQ